MKGNYTVNDRLDFNVHCHCQWHTSSPRGVSSVNCAGEVKLVKPSEAESRDRLETPTSVWRDRAGDCVLFPTLAIILVLPGIA